MSKETRKQLYSLVPFVGFLVCYFGFGIYHTKQGVDFAFYKFPAPSCALIGLGLALALGWRHIDKRVSTFVRGIAEEPVIIMCLIFMLAGAFANLAKSMGGVESTVHLGLTLLPGKLILPGVFLMSCLISLAMGTSMGTIGAVAPVAIGISETVGISLPLMSGAVLGGAMFGDNLSVISDTTIAATGSQGATMRSKTVMNLKIAIPAAAVVLVLLFIFSKSGTPGKTFDYSLIKTLPYAAVLALALAGINVIAVLMIGIFLATGIGIGTDAFTFAGFGKIAYDGIVNMSEVFYVAILVAGLAAIAMEQGGLDLILRKLERFIRGKRSAEFGIGGLVSLADICTANNTVAIVVSGGMARKVAAKFGISPRRSASVLDIFSCIWQGLIPYGAQLLLIGSLAKLSPFVIIPFAWYSMALAVSVVSAIVFGYPKEAESQLS